MILNLSLFFPLSLLASVLKFLNKDIPNLIKCTELKSLLSMMKNTMSHGCAVIQLKWLLCEWGLCCFVSFFPQVLL